MKSFKIITYTSLFSLLFVCNIATAQKVDNQNDNSKEYKTLCQKNLDRERFGFKKGKASAGLGIARSSTFEKKDEEEVNRKIKVSPNSASNYGSRANLMIKKKNYKKALSDLNTAITIAPNQVSYYVQRAKLKIEYLKDIKQGFADFDKAVKLEPSNYLTYWSRSFVFQDIKDYEGALKDLDKALLLKPYKSDVYAQRADIKSNNLRDYRGAIFEVNKAIEIEPYKATYYISRSRFNINNEEYQKALVDIDKAIEIEPNNLSHYSHRISLKKGYLNDHQGALADEYKRNDLMSKSRYFFPYFNFIERTENTDFYMKFLSAYDLAIKNEPYNASYYINRAKIKAYYLDDREGGIADFNKAIEIEPNNPSYYLDYAIIEEYDLKDFKGALINYNKAIEIDPNNSFNYLQRACFRQNNSQENVSILSDYNKAIQISPSISFLYAYRAEFKDKIGDKKGAINDLQKENSLKEMEK